MEEEFKTTFYSKGFIPNGDESIPITNKVEDKGSCAKTMRSNLTNNMRYFILEHKGSFVNPFDADFIRMKKGSATWRRVSQEVFQDYVSFLMTGKELYLRHAERAL